MCQKIPSVELSTKIFDPAICPVKSLLKLIGDKWSLVILTHLRFNQYRFSELQSAMPDISQRMLTKALRNLEREGLVNRTITPTVPPRVDYDLTKLGASLQIQLSHLSSWAVTHQHDVEVSCKRFDSEHLHPSRATSNKIQPL